MGKVRRVDFHPDDFISGIFGRLTAVEVGLYWTVCTYIYAEGGPIDEDHDLLARCLKMRRPQVKAALDSLVEKGKLQRNMHEGVTKLTQRRAVGELDAARRRIETNTKNARGGQKDEENQSNDQATALCVVERPAVQPPTTNHQPSTTKKREAAADAAPARKGTRLDPDWKPSADLIAWVTKERPDLNWQAETENFRDYWLAKTGKDATKLDWDRTWRKWMRTARANGKAAAPAQGFDPMAGAKRAADCINNNRGYMKATVSAVDVRQAIAAGITTAEKARAQGWSV